MKKSSGARRTPWCPRRCAAAVPAASRSGGGQGGGEEGGAEAADASAARILLQGRCPQEAPVARLRGEPRDPGVSGGFRAADCPDGRRPPVLIANLAASSATSLFVGVVAAEAGGRVALGQLAEVVGRRSGPTRRTRWAYSCGVSFRPARPAGAGQPPERPPVQALDRRPGAAPSRSGLRVTSCASRTACARRRRKPARDQQQRRQQARARPTIATMRARDACAAGAARWRPARRASSSCRPRS